MSDAQKQPSSLRSHHILMAAAGLVLVAAGAGNAIFSARAGTTAQQPSAQGAAADETAVPSDAGSTPPGADKTIIAQRLGLLVAEAGATNAQGSVNASGTTNVNSDPLLEAAAGAQAVAQSAGLKTAVGGFWRTAWNKSWPFLKSMTLKFFGLIGQAWRAIVNAFSKNVTITVNGNVNGSINASVNAAAATNAAQ